MPLTSESQSSEITHEQEMEKKDIKEDSLKHLSDEASAPFNLKFMPSLMIELVHYNMEA